MLRPEEIKGRRSEVSCCVELAGESPVVVSAGAPRSRPRVWGEIPPPERGVESPREPYGSCGGEQSRGPNVK